MSYKLFTGDRTFSSWSLRGWLMFERFSLACRVRSERLYAGTLAGDLAPVAPARLAPALRAPEGAALCDSYDRLPYGMDLKAAPWPGPDPLPARPVDHGPAANAACRYSGRPVSHFPEMDGHVFGFCKARCRDKTVRDPAAFPVFMDLRASAPGTA